MSILSDTDILARGPTLIYPFHTSHVQPSSYDLTLYGELLSPKAGSRIDLRYDEPADFMQRSPFEEYVIKPGECILGATNEVVYCPPDLSARVEGKSSLGRLFLTAHITAGVIDSGFKGQITLEIVNHGPWEIVLYRNMKIAQLSYFSLSSAVQTLYGSSKLGSHYNGQMGPTPAAGRRGKA